MKFTAQQIATLVNGVVVGNENATVSNIAKIEEGKMGDLSFLANLKYEEHLYTTQASVILLNDNYTLKKEISSTIIKVKDAYAAFALLLKTYEEITASKPKEIIEQPSFISTTAKIGEKTYIGAFTYIGENVMVENNTQIYPNCSIGDHVKIGKNTIIYAGVKIYKNCIIGDNVIIHAGTVIGSDGFGFAFENGKFVKIPQLGNVVIENDVEIGANCTIDRATIGSTLIKSNVKLDNLIQIAHNVEIGSSTVIASQAGISGSTKIGNYCMIGGQAGIVGHIKIADQTKINAQSGVSKEVKETGKSLTGSPAFEYRASLKSQAAMRHLPEMEKRISELEQIILNLKK